MPIIVTNTNNSGPGSLRAALASALSGDSILFDSSLTGQTITLTSTLTVSTNVTITGSVTLSGGGTIRVLSVLQNRHLTLDGLTITDGFIADGGGPWKNVWGGAGLYSEESTLIHLNNCTFTNCRAIMGAGVSTLRFCNLTVVGCTFDNNDATMGQEEQGAGGLHVEEGCTLSVQGCTFTNNKGVNGGGLGNLLSYITIEDCLFDNNDTRLGGLIPPNTRGHGGAIYFDGTSPHPSGVPVGGQAIIRRCTFTNNKGAGQGGGLFLYMYGTDSVLIEDCTIDGNEVITDTQGDSLGGGLRVGNGQFSIRGCTISNNLALNQGGGVWLGETCPMEMVNCTLSNNRADNGPGNGLGGAIMFVNGSSPCSITNCTFYGNYAGFMGGAFWGGGFNVTLANSVFSGSTAGNPWGIKVHTGYEFADGGGNYQYPPVSPTDPSDVKVTASVIQADPLLEALANNGGLTLTHLLGTGSPAIDGGNAGALPPGLSTDQRGLARISGVGVDSGSVEIQPVYAVYQGTTQLVNAVSYPLTAPLDLGTTALGTPISLTLRIVNDGLSVVNLLGVSISGVGYTTDLTPMALDPSTSYTFTVTYDAAALGTEPGTITLDTDSPSVPSYAVKFLARTLSSLSVILTLSQGGTNIVNGSGGVDYSVTTVGAPITRTFNINNAGTLDGTLASLVLPPGFSLVGAFPGLVAASGDVTFQVRLDANVAGSYSGTMSFQTNDPDDSTYTCALYGVVNPPSQASVVITTPTNTPIPPNVPVVLPPRSVGATVSFVMRLSNQGNTPLIPSGVTLPSGIILATLLPSSLSPGQAIDLVFGVDTTTAGIISGTLGFLSNDPASPYAIPISMVVTPVSSEIEFSLYGGPILSNGTLVSFPTVAVSGSCSKRFTIKNLGAGVLNLGTPVLTGPFSLMNAFPVTIPSLSEATFDIKMVTANLGTFTGSLDFSNNDPDEGSISISLQGQVITISPAPTPMAGPLANRPKSVPVGSIYLDTDGVVAYTYYAGRWLRYSQIPLEQYLAGTTYPIIGLWPVGTMLCLIGDVAPPGWSLVDGRELAISSNTVLYSIIGSTYGLTNGSGGIGTTHFRLPTLKLYELMYDAPICGAYGGRLVDGLPLRIPIRWVVKL